MSCDTSAMLPVIEQATAYLREAGVQPWRFWCYVLVQHVEESHKRILALRDMGVQPSHSHTATMTAGSRLPSRNTSPDG